MVMGCCRCSGSGSGWFLVAVMFFMVVVGRCG